MATDYGPCATWDVIWTCDVSLASPAATGYAADFATRVLWSLTGRQFGLCEVTFRPCRFESADAPWPGGWTEWVGGTWPQPALIGGLWYNLTCGSCQGTCSCTQLSEVLLPAPVHSVVQVRVDGSPLATGGAYRVDDARKLVRLGGATWPWCNDLNLADTEPGTWSVTARFGQDVPLAGKVAAGELACELLRAINGEDCRIPRAVTSIARQGVTISYPNVTEMFQRGLTGLYLTDMFIQSVNPAHLTSASAAQVYRVDQPPLRRAGT